ncbi:hypothetical protein BD626DRAFT_460225 [Schizophyllum amplum]|uniref:F-box domain-containing protein n=1 Tax=Schizophyllum amplum TaxID=97359 RepID=A0A550C9C2_9AGAR|nr:hypothetical protein BD626DRAFT_460225 [Auriculariopsis ampla]
MRPMRAAAISAKNSLGTTVHDHHDDRRSHERQASSCSNESDEGEPAPPPRKRVKKACDGLTKQTKVPRGKRRKPSAFMDLPLEIHYEIYGYLAPKELLYLSRTSKNIRVALMGRSARSLWKQSFARVEDLPPVPFGMSEPRYASLIFEKRCEYCRAHNAGTIAWCVGVRCCKKCLNRFFHKKTWLPDLRSPAESSNKWYEMSQLVPGVVGLTFTGDRCMFYPNDIVDEYEAEAEQIEDEDEWEEWYANKLDLCKITEIYIQPYVEWEKRVQASEADERDRIRSQRLDFIRQRLTDMGYGDSLEFLDRNAPNKMQKHKALRKAQELTDEAWPEIANELIALMEDVKKNWRVKYLKGRARRRTIPRSFVTPGLRYSYWPEDE